MTGGGNTRGRGKKNDDDDDGNRDAVGVDCCVRLARLVSGVGAGAWSRIATRAVAEPSRRGVGSGEEADVGEDVGADEGWDSADREE